MSNNIDGLILPEDALNRFQKPETALFGLNIKTQEYVLTRYGFKIGNIKLLISENTLCEVINNFQIYPIPSTKPWIPGLVNLRGNLIPVCDLQLLLELSDAPLKHEKLLIIDKGAMSIGILVKDLPQPCNTKSWSLLDEMPELPTGLAKYANEAYSAADNAVWVGFKHKKFFEDMKGRVAC